MTTRWMSATRSVMPRSTSATALVMHALAMSTAIRSRPQKPRQRRRSVGAFVGAAPRVGRRPRHSPRCSRSQTHAASGDSVVVVAPGRAGGGRAAQPVEVLPEHQHDIGAGQLGVGHQLGAGHDALQQLRLGQVGRGVADLAVVDEAAWVVLDPAAHEALLLELLGGVAGRAVDPGAVAHQHPHVDRADRGGAPAAVARRPAARSWWSGSAPRPGGRPAPRRPRAASRAGTTRPSHPSSTGGSRRSDRCRRPRRGP